MDELEVCAVGCTVTVDGEVYARRPEFGRLCGSCFSRVLYRLEEAPGIVGALRGRIVPLAAVKVEARVSGSHETPLPFRDDALEAADELYATVATWALAHAQTMGVRPPEPLLRFDSAGVDPSRLPANLSPRSAAQRTKGVVDWLVKWAESIAWLGPDLSAKAYHDDVVDLVRRMRGAAGLSVPRRRVVDRDGWVCRVCLSDQGEIDVPDAGPMVARCRGCHAVFPLVDLEMAAAS